MKSVWMVLALVMSLGTAAFAQQAQTKDAPPAKKGKLLIAARTGVEDVQELTASFHLAQVAAESGHLEKVVWIGYGRSVLAFDPNVKAVPDGVRKAMKDAQAAGVELVVCNTALGKYGIDPAKIEPKAKVVPKGMAEIARLISEGYEVMSY